MADDDQSGPRITELITPLTYRWPTRSEAGGCSLSLPFGAIHETSGKVPAAASAGQILTDWTFETCPSWCTVRKSGSGFQTSRVPTFCGFGAHVIAPSSQSGWVPGSTKYPQLTPALCNSHVRSVHAKSGAVEPLESVSVCSRALAHVDARVGSTQWADHPDTMYS